MNQDHEYHIFLRYFNYFWRWKYFIIVGTFICGCAGAIISLSMPKIYRIEMMLNPGTVFINEGTPEMYFHSQANGYSIASPPDYFYYHYPVRISAGVSDDVKSFIETGLFSERLSECLDSKIKKDFDEPFQFRYDIDQQTDIMKISYDTENIDFGISLFACLQEVLIEEYSGFVEYFNNEIRKRITLNRMKYQTLMERKVASIKLINDMEVRISQLQRKANPEKGASVTTDQSKSDLGQNPNGRLDDREKLLDQTIAHTIQLEKEKSRLTNITEELDRVSTRLEKSTDDRKEIEPIQIRKAPTSSKHPIAPDIRKNILVSVGSGFVLMVLISFLIENVRHASNIRESNR